MLVYLNEIRYSTATSYVEIEGKANPEDSTLGLSGLKRGIF